MILTSFRLIPWTKKKTVGAGRVSRSRQCPPSLPPSLLPPSPADALIPLLCPRPPPNVLRRVGTGAPRALPAKLAQHVF